MPSRLLLESHTYWLGLIRVIFTTKTHALLVSFKSSDMTHYVHRSVSFRNNIIMPLQMSMVRRNMLLIISTLYHILCKSRILLRFTVIHHQLSDGRVSCTFGTHSMGTLHGCSVKNALMASGCSRFGEKSRCASSLEQTTTSRRKIVPQKSTANSIQHQLFPVVITHKPA